MNKLTYHKPIITIKKIKLSFFLSNVSWIDQFNLVGKVYAQSDCGVGGVSCGGGCSACGGCGGGCNTSGGGQQDGYGMGDIDPESCGSSDAQGGFG